VGLTDDQWITITSSALFSLLALHSRKLILIESVERLLEKSEREAFVDLLHMIRKDEGWRIIPHPACLSSDIAFFTS